ADAASPHSCPQQREASSVWPLPRGLTEDSSMDGKIVMECIDAAYASIKQHADEIMVLDQSIGDGDHVFNLIRGLEALRGIRGDIEKLEAGPALKLAANKVLSTVGGSSGPLFSSLLMGMARASEHLNGDPPGYAQMYAAGVEAVQ